MRIAILYSGGKDSTLTLHYYLSQGWDVACLLSLLPENEDSYMFQNTDETLVKAQAAALDIPLQTQRTKGVEEEELKDLVTLIANAHGIQGVAVGALASDYQHVRVNHACHELGLRTFAPLWHKKQETLLREVIVAGYDVRISRIAALGLDESWLGRTLTLDDVQRLEELRDRYGLHVGGEGGEFETVVLDGPFFTRPVSVSVEKRMESGERGDARFTPESQ